MTYGACSARLGCRAVLAIRKEHIEHNVRELYNFSRKRIIAVVKSDAYGIGVRHVAPLLDKLPEIDSFAVACAHEGALLRELGIEKEILVLGGVFPEEIPIVVSYSLTPVVSDPEHLKALGKEKIPFHIKYDTGMGRLGFLEEVVRDPRAVGVMSHLSSPADREFSLLQIRRFETLVGKYRKGLKVHIESSAGVIYRVPFATHIRVGLALYGEKPLRDYPVNLKPAVSIKAKLISVKEIPAGHPVSYGRTFVAPRRMRIGVVAFGYADGLMKSLSNRGYLLYGDRKLKILGNITMDMTVVELGNVPAGVGDWVSIVDENRSFGELAREAGTIPYEIMCNISERVERRVI